MTNTKTEYKDGQIQLWKCTINVQNT